MANVPPTFWRFVICDLDGTPITVLSAYASGKQLSFPLNQPASIAFTVPSDSPQVSILHTDGEPYLSVGNRVLKAWRRVANESTWTLRFAGIVWTLQDDGDGDTSKTAVTAYDPYQVLTRRWVRNAAGKVYKTVIFNGVNGDQIAKQMVDRTISFAGPCGIATDGTFTTAPVQTAAFDQAFIAPSLITMCNTGLLDVAFDPVDRTDGIIASMSAMPRRGQDRPNIVISYAAPGRSAYRMNRVVTMDTFANDIRLWAGHTTGHLSRQQDAASIAKYYRYEDGQVLTDVHTPGLVDDLAIEELALRKDPRDLLTLLPTPELAPMPFRDFFLGDSIQVYMGVGSDQNPPQTRQAISGLQRVYGIAIDVDDDGVERVSGLDLAPVT